MDKYASDFRNRISTRAVAMGVVVVSALMILLMALGAGLKIWDFDITQVSTLGIPFWTWAFAAWILSVFIGSFATAVLGRGTSKRDGALYGLTVWAGSCVFGCLVVVYFTGQFFSLMNTETVPGAYFGAFIGNTFALAASLYGGLRGARYEAITPPEGFAQSPLDVHRSERHAYGAT
jgi:hypothetical protein